MTRVVDYLDSLVEQYEVGTVCGHGQATYVSVQRAPNPTLEARDHERAIVALCMAMQVLRPSS